MNFSPCWAMGQPMKLFMHIFCGPFDYQVFKGASLFGIRFMAKGVQNALKSRNPFRALVMNKL